MRKSILFIVLAVGLCAVSARAGEGTPEDRAAIEAAARDYIDGWYDGDVARMERALHPDLAKRTIRALPTGGEVVNHLSRSNMIAYTEAGFGKQSKQEGQHNEVIILDVLTRTASVKTVSHEFIDYIHLARIDGEWKIINVLWEPANP